MRRATGILALLLLFSTIFCSTISAQGNYRIQRGALSESAQDPASDPSNDVPVPQPNNYKMQPEASAAIRPLQGAIEHRTTWVDPSQYMTPMTGRAQSPAPKYGAGQGQAPLTDAAQYQAPMSGRADLAPLFGDTARTQIRAGVDERGPLSAGARTTPLRSDVARTATMPPFSMNTSKTRLPGDISDPELNLLRQRDIVIMQDRSSSMGEHENFPQGYFPRWYWCLNQAIDFRRQTMRLPNWMFTLVLFSSKFDIYRNVTMDQLPAVFDRNHIFIGTKLAEPMAEQLNEYFQRRAQGHARPLLIVVVTDGKPKDENDLAQVIIDATHQLQSSREVHITILQVGTDDESMRKLAMLDNGLVPRGAKFDIVSVMPFEQVTRLGLTRAMLKAVQDSGH